MTIIEPIHIPEEVSETDETLDWPDLDTVPSELMDLDNPCPWKQTNFL